MQGKPHHITKTNIFYFFFKKKNLVITLQYSAILSIEISRAINSDFHLVTVATVAQTYKGNIILITFNSVGKVKTKDAHSQKKKKRE